MSLSKYVEKAANVVHWRADTVLVTDEVSSKDALGRVNLNRRVMCEMTAEGLHPEKI